VPRLLCAFSFTFSVEQIEEIHDYFAPQLEDFRSTQRAAYAWPFAHVYGCVYHYHSHSILNSGEVFIAVEFPVCKIQLVKFSVLIATPADEHDAPGVLNFTSNNFFVQGVPVRIELGPKDMKQKQVVAVRRDTGEKLTLQRETAESDILQLLETIQHNMLDR
jgi:hypothetical protein